MATLNILYNRVNTLNKVIDRLSIQEYFKSDSDKFSLSIPDYDLDTWSVSQLVEFVISGRYS